MANCNSNFWLGLGIGSVIGALVYRFSCTPKAKEFTGKVCDSLCKMSGQTEEMVDTAKEKALDAGVKVADKVADAAHTIAEKADDLKDKVHSAASQAKK